MYKYGHRQWSEGTPCSRFAKAKQIKVWLVPGRKASWEPCSCALCSMARCATNGISKSYFKPIMFSQDHSNLFHFIRFSLTYSFYFVRNTFQQNQQIFISNKQSRASARPWAFVGNQVLVQQMYSRLFFSHVQPTHLPCLCMLKKHFFLWKDQSSTSRAFYAVDPAHVSGLLVIKLWIVLSKVDGRGSCINKNSV